MNAPYAPQQGQPIAPPPPAANPMQQQGQAPQQAANPMQAQMAQALQPAPKPVTHDVTIVTTRKLAQAKVMGVPPEEFGIERGARTVKDCNYCFHETQKSVGSLVEQGFDEAQVTGLISNNDMSTERLSRDTIDEDMPTRETLNPTARLVRVTEHYIRIDLEGTGRPCIYRITTAGESGDILKRDGKDDIAKVDVYPFAATSPVPVTHRFFGRSIADLIMDIQRIKTALVRGMLDNLYLHNNPRVEVAEQNAGQNTLDDLLVSRPGGVVRTKTPGGLTWQVVPDITGSIYPALQYMDATREARTGMTAQSQGIDANALQNQSATAVAQVFSATQMRTKLIARILAEGVRDMFSLLHGTIRKHGQQQQTVRLRNSWVDVDPRNWKTRNDMTVNVGLGTGSKAQQFAQMTALANFQKELLLGGKANMVDDTNLFNTATEMSKILGHKNADRFFNDPKATDPKTGQLMHPPAPPAPDPKLAVEQFKAQAAQATNEHKAQLEQAKAQTDALHQQIKAQADIEVAKVKADLDAKIAIINAHMKEIESEQKMRHAEQSHQHDMAHSVIDLVATAHAHDTKMAQSDQAHQAGMQKMQQKPKPTE